MIWILNTDSPINICNSLQKLQVNRRFGDDEIFLNIEDRRSIPIQVLGIIKLVFNSHVVILSDCHFCPSFLLKIISVGLLAKNSYKISIKKNYNIILNDVTMMNG